MANSRNEPVRNTMTEFQSGTVIVLDADDSLLLGDSQKGSSTQRTAI